MKQFTLPAFDEGTTTGYNSLLAFINRAFSSKRCLNISKVAYLEDLADAAKEVAEKYRARALEEIFSDGDLRHYTSLDLFSRPYSEKHYGKEFFFHGIACQISGTAKYADKDIVAKLQDPIWRVSSAGQAFLQSDQGQDIDAALNEYNHRTQVMSSAYEVLCSHVNDYLACNKLPAKVYNPLTAALKIVDKDPAKTVKKKGSKTGSKPSAERAKKS